MDEVGIKALASKCENICCCDSFLPHLLAPSRRKLIVLFSKSDPDIFGYPHNINLLKDKELLRPDQYRVWSQCMYDPNAFVDYRILVDLLK
jgi:ADP-heptose:LPS heptosyltransferase